MIYVIATANIRLDSREAFMAGARKCIAETVKEKGCISYDLCASVTDPSSFVFVERWVAREDLTAHGNSPHIAEWRKVSEPMKISPTVIEIISGGSVEKK